MKESARQSPPKKRNYRVFWIGRCNWADRLLVKRECWAGPPPKKYMAFWIGKCIWAHRFLVKGSAGQPHSPKKLQGVLDRAVQLGT